MPFDGSGSLSDWTFHFGLSTLDFPLWTFHFGLSTLDFRLWTFDLDFGLRTSDFGLQTSAIFDLQLNPVNPVNPVNFHQSL